MTDFLKKSITERREEFDLYDSNLDQAWENIDQRLDARPEVAIAGQGWWRLAAKIAAAVALIACAALLFFWQTSTDGGQPTLSMVSPEMAETEQYYAMMITEKLTAIEQSGQLDPVLADDLRALDQAYTELRADLGDNLDNEEVIDAMIINYKIKLEVLDRVLRQMKEVKNGVEVQESSL